MSHPPVPVAAAQACSGNSDDHSVWFRGRVRDLFQDNRLLELGIEGCFNLEEAQATTNAEGRFTLLIPEPLIAEISHKLTFEKEDYQRRTLTVNLADGKASYDFFLESQLP